MVVFLAINTVSTAHVWYRHACVYTMNHAYAVVIITMRVVAGGFTHHHVEHGISLILAR